MSKKAYAKSRIVAALTRLDGGERADVLAALLAHAHRFGDGGEAGLGADFERITRYASKVAQAENRKRGDSAGSARALPGSTCMTVVSDLCTAVSEGLGACEAHNAQRVNAGMLDGHGADAPIDEADYSALFARS